MALPEYALSFGLRQMSLLPERYFSEHDSKSVDIFSERTSGWKKLWSYAGNRSVYSLVRHVFNAYRSCNSGKRDAAIFSVCQLRDCFHRIVDFVMGFT